VPRAAALAGLLPEFLPLHGIGGSKDLPIPLALAISGNPAFRVDELEKQRPGPSFTVDTLANLHEALVPHGLIFPLHLGAEGSAQIGGLIGTNAGGSQAFRYGMMQDAVENLIAALGGNVEKNCVNPQALK
jgi:hypothetical protein